MPIRMKRVFELENLEHELCRRVSYNQPLHDYEKLELKILIKYIFNPQFS